MATASNDSSRHRDPVVDANPDLTRKRQRLSEEALSASPPSSNNSVVVEAVETEASGANVDSTDLLLEHGSIKMQQHSNGFAPLVGTKFADDPPIEQLEVLIRHVDAKRYLAPKMFQNLTSWISWHIEQFYDDQSRQAVYLSDQEFFGRLGQLMCIILSSEDLFATETILDFGQARLTDLISTFLRLTFKLSTCVVACLPDVVKATIARRDSAQIRGQQKVDLLWHVQVLELVLSARKETTLIDLLLRLERPQRQMQSSIDGVCLDSKNTDTVLLLLQKLCQCHRDIALTWPTIGAILGITQVVDLTTYERTEQFMEAAHRYIHPTIREKHPRALPYGFHEKFVTASQSILETLLRARPDEIQNLYQQFVQSDGDALLPQSTPDQSWTQSLRTVCHNDDGIAIDLLTTCWVLEALKSFILSDIMDVRGCGIIQLGKRLIELHKAAQITSYRLDHPVVQFVARFLRSNEFTKYIFGPNSHANLISHSQNIFGFLAVTYAYTDVDTDIIWNACTTSVEAEFVKASFDVLVDMIRNLEWDRLLYLAAKYVDTAPEKLGKDAVDSLEHLFKKLASTRSHHPGSQGHLATAFLSIDILKQHYSRHESKASPELCHIAMAELTRFAYRDRCSASDQSQILEQCIPDLVKPSEHALESAVVVGLFLKHAQSPDAYHELADPSMISAVAAELIKYIARCRETLAAQSVLRMACISHRIEVVLRLMAMSDIEVDRNMLGDFFVHCFAGLAVDTMARNDAWARLRSLALEGAPPYFHAFMRRFLAHLFRNEVPKMALQDFSPPLMEMLYRELAIETQTKELRLDFDRLLELPVWSKLVEVAELAREPELREIALTNLSSILFDAPCMKHPVGIVGSAVDSCHTKFIRQRIDRLHSTYALRESNSTDAIQLLAQQLDLLTKILHKSKAAALMPNPRPLEISLAADDKEDDLVFTLELYIGIAPKQKSVTVKAASTTTLADLLAVLPDITKSTDNRIIVKGRELNQETEAKKRLVAIDLQPACLMAVCPKYSFDNIDIIFTFDQIGVVERELREHYNRLETLLHGPPDIAHKMFVFLRNLQSPLSARQRVVSSTATVDELFPKDFPSRTALSIHILGVHFHDFCKLGVVDDGFVVRSVRLLVALLVDPARCSTDLLRYQALFCLNEFLKEHLDNMDGPDLVENADSFANAMISVLMETTVNEPSQGSSNIGIEIMKLCYMALLGLFERQPSIWYAFVAHEHAVDLHSRVLLDDNLHQIAGQIINFCRQTTKQAIPDFYVSLMTSILPQALTRDIPAKSFYQFAHDVLFEPAMSSVRSDQMKARALVDSLTTILWTYEHSESIDLPIIDNNMHGLMIVVEAAIQILKSFKVPLRLDDLSVKVFQTFLFSAVPDGLDRILIDKRTRKAAFRIVEQTCESAAIFDKLCSTATTLLQASRDYALETYCHPEWARPASHCAGLDNLGMTCYMNSLIQQLYANVHFRQFIFETPILDSAKQACLVEVQRLFARMQTQAHRSVRPVDLANTLSIRTDSQEDVHGFYGDFISRLETEMPNEESKAALTQLFTGRLLSQIKGECGHVSTRTEPFVDLPVLVKNKPGLKESLDEFVQGEPMAGANKYKCLACDPMGEGRLVDAMKRACPEKIPNNLTFCLKRFSFEAMFNMDDKVNDRFEFPQTIDMSAYHHTKVEEPSLACEPDPFELVGVIVHQGTLQFGHYWSYTLLRNTAESTSRVWVKLEDKNATTCPNGFETIQRECFGGEWFTNGQERTDNAYVLFYQRRVTLEEPLSTLIPARDPTTGELLPPRVKLPEHLASTISQENREQYLVNHLTDHAFVELVKWLMQNSPSLTGDSSPDPDSGESEEDRSPRSANGSAELVAARPQADVAGVVVALMQRLATCAVAPTSELALLMDQLKFMIRVRPSLAYPYLSRFLEEGSWTGLLTLDGRNMRRLGLSDLVQCLFASVREADQLAYRGLFEKMCTQFQSLFESKRENSTQLNWLAAFDMIGWMAARGPWETTQILQHGFVRFAFNMLYLPWSETLQAEYPLVLAFMKRRPSQVSSVYRFITLVLGQTWVRMDDAGDSDETIFLTEDGTVHLSPELVRYVHGAPTNGAMSFWMQSAAMADKDGQEYFTPAKLMSLLLTSDHVPDFIKQSIPTSLNTYIDKEDAALRPIILMVEEFCVACGDDVRAADAMKHLALTIDLWPQCDELFMLFTARTYKVAPRAVADNIALWYAMYIQPSKKPTRSAGLCNEVARWLRNIFFAAEPMTDQVFEVKRIQLARRMISDLTRQIHAFYDQEQPRSKCEPAIIVLGGIGDYIEVLAMRVEATPPRSVARALRINYDEVTRDVEELKEINSLVTEWEMDDPLQFLSVHDGASDGSAISEEDEDVEATAWIDDEDLGA